MTTSTLNDLHQVMNIYMQNPLRIILLYCEMLWLIEYTIWQL